MAAKGVDFFGKGEMPRTGSACNLFWMATTTKQAHIFRVTGPGHKADVGFFCIAFLVKAPVAGGAWQVVRWIKFDRVVAPLATEGIGACKLLTCGFLGLDLAVLATAEYQEHEEYQGERAIHKLDTIP